MLMWKGGSGRSYRTISTLFPPLFAHMQREPVEVYCSRVVKSIATNYLSLKQMILKFFYVMIINFLLLVNTNTRAHIELNRR